MKWSPVVSNRKLVHFFSDHFCYLEREHNTIIPCKCVCPKKQMLQYNCTNYLTFFLMFFFLKNSLLLVCSWWLSFRHFFSGFRHVWITACLSNPVKSNKWDNVQQVMQLKAWIILLEQLSKCPWCIYILAAPPTAFCTWRSFASQLILC